MSRGHDISFRWERVWEEGYKDETLWIIHKQNTEYYCFECQLMKLRYAVWLEKSK